jgi:hypothetical protein
MSRSHNDGFGMLASRAETFHSDLRLGKDCGPKQPIGFPLPSQLLADRGIDPERDEIVIVPFSNAN